MTGLTAQQVVRDIEARMLGLTGANVTAWEMRVLLAERRELLARQMPDPRKPPCGGYCLKPHDDGYRCCDKPGCWMTPKDVLL